MRIEKSNQAGQVPVTTLVGQLRDQAALFGVLNSLYDFVRGTPGRVKENEINEALHSKPREASFFVGLISL